MARRSSSRTSSRSGSLFLTMLRRSFKRLAARARRHAVGRRAAALPRPAPLRVRLSAQGLMRRCIRAGGLGAGVLAAGQSGWAVAAPNFGSPAWFAQHNAGVAPAAGGRATGTGGNLGGTTGGSVTSPEVALQRATRSMANLSRAAEMITAAHNAQQAARQLALTQPNPTGVSDGLTAGGLVPDADAAADLANPNTCGTYGCSWVNLELPTETVSAEGQHTVTVEQNDQRAIATWDSFNVGRDTTLHFDQSEGTQADGSNSWVVLNRVNASDAPSQILGQITAEGSVYVINPNGIVFGGSAQVNVHSLIATTLNPSLGGGYAADAFGSNLAFLTSGVIYNGALFEQPLEDLEWATDQNGNLAPVPGQTETPIAMGEIQIDAGAEIVTGANGYSLIAAPTVRNAGLIVADDGQAILAGGSGLIVNVEDAASVGFGVTAGVLGNTDGQVTAPGLVEHTGLIQARRGSVLLTGSDVIIGSAETAAGDTQTGTILTTTSLTRPGSIDIIADFVPSGGDLGYAGVAALDEGALLAVLPDLDSTETTTSSDEADAAFSGGSVHVEGTAVRMLSDALIIAPGQEVTLEAHLLPLLASGVAAPLDGSIAGRVYLATGAAIDVAGLADVDQSVTINAVEVPRLGQNELADSPLQRDGVLYRSAIIIDRRRSGEREDGSDWDGTPIANVEGYIDLVERDITELLVDGGDITLAGAEVLTAENSLLNLDGGYLRYDGGFVPTTRLITETGAVVDIADADPNQVYVAIAGLSQQAHARWNVTDTYVNPLLQGRSYETTYVEGGDAGTLEVQLSGILENGVASGFTQVLAGDISAQVVAGRHQVANGEMPSGGSFVLGGVSGGFDGGPLSLLVNDEDAELDAEDGAFDFDTALPDADLSVTDPWNHPELAVYWSQLDGQQLTDAGFANIELSTSGVLRVEGAGLAVQDGGAITLNASRVTLAADLTAASGDIAVHAYGRTGDNSGFNFTGPSIFTPFGSAPSAMLAGDIEVLPGVTLSTRGRFVNDAGRDIDSLQGSAYIDGGSISLLAMAATGQQLESGSRNNSSAQYGETQDLTGSVILAQGSLLDVSSGAYVQADGRLASSGGIALGEGGSIALVTYGYDGQDDTYTQPYLFTDAETGQGAAPSRGRLQLDGTLLAYGFSGGGTLALQALGFSIGETDAAQPAGTLSLDADLFATQGFGAYQLQALYGANIHDGSTVELGQQVLDSQQPEALDALTAAATGSDVYALTTVGLLTTANGVRDNYRDSTVLGAVDFSLVGGGYLTWDDGSGSFADYDALCDGTAACADGTVRLGDGASLLAQAGSSVTLGSHDQLTVLGQIVAHGGDIALSGDTSARSVVALARMGNSTDNYAAADQSVWVGRDAVLDVSGVVLTDPRAPVLEDGVQPVTGELLDGGSVTLVNDSGYVIVADGARIDVSGATGTLELPSAADASQLTPTAVWSDAGTMTLGGSAGLYFDGQIAAHGGSDASGAEAGRGGTLVVLPQQADDFTQLDSGDGELSDFIGARALVITQQGIGLPDNELLPGVTVEADGVTGLLHFAADSLDGSGVDNLYLGQDPERISGSPTAIVFDAGSEPDNLDISIQVDGRLVANASSFVGQAADGQDLDVSLSGAYVALHGYAQDYPLPDAPGTPVSGMSLAVSATNIDLGGVFTLDGFDVVQFSAEQDLRFLTPARFAGTGYLATAADLNFAAARSYIASANSFVISAVRDGGATVRFLPGADGQTDDSVPLSAGGTLLVNAAMIEQSGVLRAPAGQIVLGVGDPDDAATQALFDVNGATPTLVATEQLVLAAGSLTSVSLDGATVPYGSTIDGQDWVYLSSTDFLEAPPSAAIRLSGADVALQDGAVVDLSGGGDLQAQEWVAGTGGSRNALSSDYYADGRGVYAIVPAYEGLSAYDPAFASDPLLGQTVHLSGSGGLPEGDYVLLPAGYATLPGAYRVVHDPNTQDSITAQNAVLADGSLSLSGWFVDGDTGARDARSSRFIVQSSDEGVWQQYSEYLLTGANEFFAALAQANQTQQPQLPLDAGRLVIAAGQTLSALDATLQTSAGEGGSAAQVDIASERIQIVAEGGVADQGYVAISASDLNALGAGSLLIGGTRDSSDAGLALDALASSVVVDNGADTLSAPELMLIASDSVVIADGASLAASGDEVDAQTLLLDGDGALLRLAAGDAGTVERSGISSDGGGLLAVGAGVSLDATGGSIVLESSQRSTLDETATLAARQIDATSNRISFVASGVTPGAEQNGIVLTEATLAQLSSAEQLTLRSRGTAEFLGDVSVAIEGDLRLDAGLFVGDGGTVAIAADTLTLGNALGARLASDGAAGGSLALSADTLVLDDGSTRYAGFADIALNADSQLTVAGQGSTDFSAANLDISSPLVVAAAGSTRSLITTGTMQLGSGGGAAAEADGSAQGGSLSLEAASLSVDTTLRANAGVLNLAASGDVQLGANAVLDAQGLANSYFDVVRYTSGGSVQLGSSDGSVLLASGARIDVSADEDGGDAGGVLLQARSGDVQIDGTVLGQAASGTGGRLGIDSHGAQDLDAIAALATSGGFDGAIAVHTATGNLSLSAGNSLTAASVSLVADAGADTLSASDDARVLIAGTVDASAPSGGDILLSGRGGVVLDGSLLANATQDGQVGGTVTLATSGSGDGSYNPDHGYQNITAENAGSIVIGAGAQIDVSGADDTRGLSGGRVELRAPLLTDGAVPVTIAAAAQDNILGAREVSLEAYARWSTTDDANATGLDAHFDGIIDPAGRYDADGQTLDGSRNAAHQAFYGETLVGFVQTPGFGFEDLEDEFAGIDSLVVRPGIELVNPDGDIQLLSHWNLGAGSQNADDTLDLVYRHGEVAPVLSLRAAGDVVLAASLSDGFFQYNNPFSTHNGSQPDELDSDNANGISPEAADGNPLPLLAMALAAGVDADGTVIETYDSSHYRIVAGADLASSNVLATVDGADGSVQLQDHEAVTVFNPQRSGASRTVVAPTMIRTGTGSIAVAAAQDILLNDPVAPGVIVAGGRPAQGTTLDTNARMVFSTSGAPWLVQAGENHPVAAGDIALSAGGDIVGLRGVVDTDGSRSGTVGTVLDQYWWPWLQGLCATLGGQDGCAGDTSTQDYSLVNYANFTQGVLSVGGDITVSAAGEIRELSLSAPVTYHVSGNQVIRYGGGDVHVRAGGDVLDSDLLVARGTGSLLSGGEIGGDSRAALQDAQLLLRARLDLALADILNPSYMNTQFDLLPYSSASSLQLESIAGDLSLATSTGAYAWGSSALQLPATSVWPATLDAIAFNGELSLDNLRVGLAPSPQGNLSLIAAGDVSISGPSSALFGLFDVAPGAMASPLNPSGRRQLLLTNGDESSAAFDDHVDGGLHALDSQPVRIYSRDGDIVQVQLEGGDTPILLPNKPAQLRAGQDIVNLRFVGQHLYASDLSVIQAGRDLYWARNVEGERTQLEIGGPGTLLVSAGRDIVLRPSARGEVSGIRSVGNLYNPYLPRGQGSDLVIQLGVAPGVSLAEFATAYLAPDRSVTDVPDYSDALIAYMLQIERDAARREGRTPPRSLTLEQAWAGFQALSEDQQSLLVYQVFYDILDTVGLDYNDPDSDNYQQYARGYQAINTLFPADLGYTRNELGGGSNGAETPVQTGSFDLRDGTVQTEQGGDISILAPGGSVLVGSVATPEGLSPGDQGILALRRGSIRIYLDRNILLAQSRIFTQQGGDVLIWSSNGDINAGRGAKTTTELASTSFVCDGEFHYCVVDAAGQVSGAGIATLQTLTNAEPGAANLVAPRGTVDAGEAGIRVAGNLNIAAAVVANADNIQVQGASVGVPSARVDSGALASASAAAAAATEAAEDLARQAPAQDAATMITVEVLGYGALPEEEKRRIRQQSGGDSQ